MPTLRCFFAIYSDGGVPLDVFTPPTDPDIEVLLKELPELVVPSRTDELFGPHVQTFARFSPKRAFLLAVSKQARSGAGNFFTLARRLCLETTVGLRGYGLDILRLWPFPLHEGDALFEEPLAEDLFSVGFTEMGEHGFRAETFGLSKLEQREISFEFQGKELLEEAALMCGHLADWAMEQGNRVQHGQSMAYGFDRLVFLAAEGESSGSFRGWHPPLVQRLLPPEIFPGVGVLEVRSLEDKDDAIPMPLTAPLTRALEQRLILEEYDLTGDAPFHTATARVRGTVLGLNSLTAIRDEPAASKDSGWRFFGHGATDGVEGALKTLGEVVARAPELVKYLALPPGSKLEWDADGKLRVDLSKARHEVDDDDDE